MKMAKAEVAPQEAPRKAMPAPAPVDPEPTASLPPAAEKVSAPSSGNPEFRWPAHGRIIQGFKSGGNDGINIAVPEGTSVKAAEAGTVAYAGSEIKGFGNLVLIRHPNGFVTRLRQQRRHRGAPRRAGQARSDHRQVRPVGQRGLATAALRAAQGLDPGRPDALSRRALSRDTGIASVTRETRAAEVGEEAAAHGSAAFLRSGTTTNRTSHPA